MYSGTPQYNTECWLLYTELALVASYSFGTWPLCCVVGLS